METIGLRLASSHVIRGVVAVAALGWVAGSLLPLMPKAQLRLPPTTASGPAKLLMVWLLLWQWTLAPEELVNSIKEEDEEMGDDDDAATVP